jgi:hypothetical protein
MHWVFRESSCALRSELIVGLKLGIHHWSLQYHAQVTSISVENPKSWLTWTRWTEIGRQEDHRNHKVNNFC